MTLAEGESYGRGTKFRCLSRILCNFSTLVVEPVMVLHRLCFSPTPFHYVEAILESKLRKDHAADRIKSYGTNKNENWVKLEGVVP